MKNKMSKKTKIAIGILAAILIAVVAFVAYTIYSLKQYTRNNTWVDLEIEVYTNAPGTVGTRVDKTEELIGLMAGDVVSIVPGCDFKILEIHPNSYMVIDVQDAYTVDDPMLSSVQHPGEISLKEGESKMLYWVGDHMDSYNIKIAVKANYYR